MFINITNGSLDGMRIDEIRYKSHTLSLRPFNDISERMKHKSFASKMAVDMKL